MREVSLVLDSFNHTMLRVKDPKASLKFYQVGAQDGAVDVVTEGVLTLRYPHRTGNSGHGAH